MRAALALAQRGLGRTWPNPTVGCVIVKDGMVVGRGRTADGGRPHGETQALAMAGAAARGATAYVTLEPCAHHGQTPPCAQALIDAGIARVVVAATDPDPRVSGRGLDMLRQAGLAVETGVLADLAHEQNAGFFLAKTSGRPLVTVKLASTLDGCIATSHGESRWITGSAARRQGHMLRSRNDAVLVGIGTVLTDDPDLTCRVPGLQDRPPVAVVVDGRLRIPLGSRLVQAAASRPVWVITSQDAPVQRLAGTGVKIIQVPGTADHTVDLAAALTALADHGLTRLMVEGGSGIVASLLATRLVDRLVWFHAPAIMGGDGLSAIQTMNVVDLSHMPRMTRRDVRGVGDDVMETYSFDARN